MLQFKSPKPTAPDFALRAMTQVRMLLKDGTPAEQILAELVWSAEEVGGPGATSSILLLDQDGLLVNGASPGLPKDYLAKIDRLRPDAQVGTCAAAAATGEIVMTPDFFSDEKWAELKHLPMALGYIAAWSVPIKVKGRVVGTFGTYFRERRYPTPEEMRCVPALADAAATVIEKSRS